MERKMRRFKQELPDIESRRILTIGKYAVWAVSGSMGGTEEGYISEYEAAVNPMIFS